MVRLAQLFSTLYTILKHALSLYGMTLEAGIFFIICVVPVESKWRRSLTNGKWGAEEHGGGEKGCLILVSHNQLHPQLDRAKLTETSNGRTYIQPSCLTFLLRSVYDFPPTPSNLLRWKLQDTASSGACDKRATLEYTLASCNSSLQNSRGDTTNFWLNWPW